MLGYKEKFLFRFLASMTKTKMNVFFNYYYFSYLKDMEIINKEDAAISFIQRNFFDILGTLE